MNTHSSLREINSINKIKNAYIQMINTPNLSIKQLCEKASITRPTFYKYFKDIYSLKNSIIDDILVEIRDLLFIHESVAIYNVSTKKIPTYLLNLLNHIEKNIILYEAFLIHTYDEYFISNFKIELAKFVEQGILSNQSDQDIVVPLNLLIHYVTGAYYETIIWWIKSNMETEPYNLVTYLLRIAIKGPYKNEIIFQTEFE